MYLDLEASLRTCTTCLTLNARDRRTVGQIELYFRMGPRDPGGHDGTILLFLIINARSRGSTHLARRGASAIHVASVTSVTTTRGRTRAHVSAAAAGGLHGAEGVTCEEATGNGSSEQASRDIPTSSLRVFIQLIPLRSQLSLITLINVINVKGTLREPTM